jgi:glycerol-3-phosphate O-acyltransferase/dihydroxyacetone phosphate acyltransferase
VVANHPNALVDAMLVGTTVSRRVLITARATLFEKRILAGLLRRIGVVPLLRVQDAPAVIGAPTLLVRNDTSLDRVTDALRLGEVVLIFPEGISHDRSSLAPLKSGAARIALQAFAKGAQNLCILPIGLVYEEKERPGSRILIKVGRPIDVAQWLERNPARGSAALTREIAFELHRVTLNFATDEHVLRAIQLARTLSVLCGDFPTRVRGIEIENEVRAADRIEIATERLEGCPAALQVRAELLIGGLQDLEARLERRGIALRDLLLTGSGVHGRLFALRECALACLILPLAVLGRVSHWLPLRAARELALYTLRSDPSRDQPAMRTILIGLLTVPAWYALQAVAITTLAGGLRAGIWLSLCVVSANLDARYRERLERAVRRARALILIPGDLGFQDAIVANSRELVQQAAELEAALLEIPPGAP